MRACSAGLDHAPLDLDDPLGAQPRDATVDEALHNHGVAQRLHLPDGKLDLLGLHGDGTPPLESMGSERVTPESAWRALSSVG